MATAGLGRNNNKCRCHQVCSWAERTWVNNSNGNKHLHKCPSSATTRRQRSSSRTKMKPLTHNGRMIWRPQTHWGGQDLMETSSSSWVAMVTLTAFPWERSDSPATAHEPRDAGFEPPPGPTNIKWVIPAQWLASRCFSPSYCKIWVKAAKPRHSFTHSDSEVKYKLHVLWNA